MNLDKLTNKNLWHQEAFIAGQWVAQNNDNPNDKCAIDNPATLEIIGHVPNLSADQITTAVEKTVQAFAHWKDTPAKQRMQLLLKWSALIKQNEEDLAYIMTCEQGKPLAEAAGEVNYAASFVDLFAQAAPNICGDVIKSPSNDKAVFALPEPIGPVAAITPWNFPAAMITRKAAAALAAGCTMIVKPAMQTPFTALALAHLAKQAGLPDGVFSVVTGTDQIIGNIFCSHPQLRKLSFTGSTAVGKHLIRETAEQIKKLSLELGGNAPFIIFADADIPAAVEGLMLSKFRNAGQTCICANRVFVHSSIEQQVTQMLADKIKSLQIGSGLDAAVNIGPLINQAAILKVERHLQDAVGKGAHVVCGGSRVQVANHSGHFFAPTMLTNCTSQMLCFREETFGPLLPIFSFDEPEQAISLANDSINGLAAYFYSQDIKRIWTVASKIEAGIVAVNTGVVSNEYMPFGGVKQSGFGIEGSKYGIQEYLNIKAVTIGGL